MANQGHSLMILEEESKKEGRLTRLFRKIKDDPVVPLGKNRK